MQTGDVPSGHTPEGGVLVGSQGQQLTVSVDVLALGADDTRIKGETT